MELVGCARVAAIDGDRVIGTLLRRSEMMLMQSVRSTDGFYLLLLNDAVFRTRKSLNAMKLCATVLASRQTSGGKTPN